MASEGPGGGPVASGQVRVRRRRPLRWFLIGSAALVVAFVLIFLVADFLGGAHGYDKPWPSFPSLASAPDASFRGTVAFIGGPGAPTATGSGGDPKMMKNSCARIVRASGGVPKEVLCWPMIDRELASVAWMPDGRLRVTGFELVEGESRPTPVWGKAIDVATGAATDVPPAQLGDDAFPQPPSTTNARGETLSVKNGEGSSKVTLQDATGSRVVFSVKDQNPGFGIVGAPQWSADGAWFVMYDGQRLLTTTTADPAVTKVLADDVSGSIGDWGATTFAMTTREW